MEDHPRFEYSQITEQIFVGTNMCCGIHTADLQHLGLDADIDLEEERSEAPPKVGVYLWLPVKDLSAPTHTQLEIGVAAIDKIVREGKKVYVHCKNGHGRGPTLVAAYFIFKGMKLEEAVAKIKEKRPEIHLEEVQIKALKDYQNHQDE